MGRWMLRRPPLRLRPSPGAEVGFLRGLVALLLAVALGEAVLLVLAVQALRSALTPSS